MSPRGELRNWNETKLWGLLEDKGDQDEADDIRSVLTQKMPEVQSILAQGGTTPTDFTLHDSQHAFRVAERMVDIIPPETLAALSTYELALLLLSAYLHDIGMCPKQSRINRHLDYVLTGTLGDGGDVLTPEQVAAFQDWLDQRTDVTDVPLCDGPPTPETLRLSHRLVAHYCRHHHADWGAGRTRELLHGQRFGTYVHWLEDLVRLCLSHLQGYDALMSDDFGPKQLGGASLVVHLRFLAAALRVADILEFDPERTPDVIFHHREIDPASAIYWHKDRYAYRLQEGDRLTLSAEPPDARVHRAIIQMTDDIEAELRLVRRIDDEKPFRVSRFQDAELLHKWGIRPDIRRDVRPHEGAYEYIDGAFRPNTEKLLQLLSGKALYGSEMVAVRELLQNAADAVREQIAYERLQRDDPHAEHWEDDLGQIHKIELTVEVDDDGVWLVCRDDGVGMSKAIIRDYLLVSGTSQPPAVRRLDRRCREAGFELGRTGQFGIGVLTYFMLADRVEILTRRGEMSPDSEAQGWHFETEGVGTFGELRKDTLPPRGTTVRLHLRPGLTDDPKEWASKLDRYLGKTVCRMPCRFVVTTDIDRRESRKYGPGWICGIEQLYGAPVARIDMRSLRSREELVTCATARRREASAEQLEQFGRAFEASMEWREFHGALPDNLGKYRIYIPVFTLCGHMSPVFISVTERDGQLLVREAFHKMFIGVPSRLMSSWCGMAIESPTESSDSHGIVQIDWVSSEAGGPKVDRAELVMTAAAANATRFVQAEARRLFRQLFVDENASPFAVLGHLLSETSSDHDRPYPVENLCWLNRADPAADGDLPWGPLDFPVATGYESLRWRGQLVPLLPSVECTAPSHWRWLDSVGLTSEHFHSPGAQAQQLLYDVGAARIATIWPEKPTICRAQYLYGYKATFPSAWGALAGAGIRSGPVAYNEAHMAAQASDEEALAWALSECERSDPRPYRNALTQDRQMALAWLARTLGGVWCDVWDALVEQERDFLETILRLAYVIGDNDSIPDTYWLSDNCLHVYSADAHLRVHGAAEIAEYLPDPGPEWTAEIIPHEDDWYGRRPRRS